jgi:hypothetical protein
MRDKPGLHAPALGTEVDIVYRFNWFFDREPLKLQ